MAITFSFDSEKNIVSITSDFEKSLSMNECESQLLEIVLSFLSSSEYIEELHVERRSRDYISLICGENDFFRFKYSDRSKWCSIRLPKSLQLSNQDNELFDAQKNKKQLHWKADLKSMSDLELLKSFIIESCLP